MEQKIINSFDGTPINVRIWAEAISPKGIIQISHDIGEHSGRYIKFADKLQDIGYIVFCPDSRAFGLSEPKDFLGYHDGDIFQDTLKDTIFLNKYFSREYNLPVFLMGIGYGGLIAQAFLEDNIPTVGIIFASTGFINKATSGVGLLSTKLLPKKNKCILFNAQIGRYNNQYKNEKGQKLWLTSDEEARKEYLSDPLCDLSLSNNFCYSLSKGLFSLHKNGQINDSEKKVPIAFFAGRQDPNTGNKASRTITLYKKYRKLGFSTVRLFIYEKARHNVLHEKDCKTYVVHMVKFINRCFNSHYRTQQNT